MSIEVDRYLLNEMSDSEREKFENAYFSDDELFYEIAERENDLVDRYANGGMKGAELERFERTLAMLPARRQKIANARSLHEFINDERVEVKSVTVPERAGFFSKLARAFSFGSPAFQFASIGLIAILGIATAFLVLENRRLGSLEQELAGSRAREAELANMIENERGTTVDLTADLDAERERIQKLEDEIAALRKAGTNEKPSTGSVSPTIATLILSPVGIRGGPPLVKRLELPASVSRVSVVVTLPGETQASERVSVKLNGEAIADNLRVRSRANGEKSISLTISVSRLKEGRNEIAVFDSKGTSLQEYAVAVSRQK